MVEVNKESKGAMLTSDGKYVVPVMDKYVGLVCYSEF